MIAILQYINQPDTRSTPPPVFITPMVITSTPWSGPGHLPPIPPALTLDRIRYKLNKNSWAEWAGTSFAAPILTGAIAAVLGKTGIRRTQDAVNALKRKYIYKDVSMYIIEEAGANFQEDVMYVKQG